MIESLRTPLGHAEQVFAAEAMMLDNGTTVAATAKWLGHDRAMTLRVYDHVDNDALASAGEALLSLDAPMN